MPDALYTATEAAREEAEAYLTPRIARLLRRQGRRIAADVEAAQDPRLTAWAADNAAADVTTALEVLDTVWGRVIPPFAEAAFTGLAEMEGKRAWSFDWLGAVRAFLAGEGAAMVARITEHTREVVRAILRAGMEEGETPDELARRLRREWPGLAAVRAERITRTETVRASNYGGVLGAQAAAENFGLRLDKVWVSTPDGRTRDSHRRMEGQRVPLALPFDVGGFAAMYPGDPALPADQSVNCRCTVVYVPEGKPLKARTWREERDERMRAHYEAVKGRFPTWVQAVEDVQAHVDGAAALSFERARRICHSKG